MLPVVLVVPVDGLVVVPRLVVPVDGLAVVPLLTVPVEGLVEVPVVVLVPVDGLVDEVPVAVPAAGFVFLVVPVESPDTAPAAGLVLPEMFLCPLFGTEVRREEPELEPFTVPLPVLEPVYLALLPLDLCEELMPEDFVVLVLLTEEFLLAMLVLETLAIPCPAPPA